MQGRIKYIGGYKYQLAVGYTMQTDITPGVDIQTPYIRLTTEGYLMIGHGYAWDGPSGAADTKNLMRASLVHDALYQLMRHEHLLPGWRAAIDKLFYNLMREDGVSFLRARYIYTAVTLFGADYAKAENKRIIEVAP
jgi:hypothetical protein